MNGETDLVQHLFGRVGQSLNEPQGLQVEALLERAARVRRRRRNTAVAGVVSAALLAVAVPALGGARAGHGPGPASGPTRSTRPAPRTAAGFVAELLPSGVGRVDAVLNKLDLRRNAAWARAGFQAQLDGRAVSGLYTIRQGGGVGLFSVAEYVDPAPGDNQPITCVTVSCSVRHLPEGVTATSWHVGPHHYGSGADAVEDGGANVVEVVYPDGRRLTLSASPGTTGARYGYGPMLPAPPLTQQQLDEVALRAAWWDTTVYPPAPVVP